MIAPAQLVPFMPLASLGGALIIAAVVGGAIALMFVLLRLDR